MADDIHVATADPVRFISKSVVVGWTAGLLVLMGMLGTALALLAAALKSWGSDFNEWLVVAGASLYWLAVLRRAVVSIERSAVDGSVSRGTAMLYIIGTPIAAGFLFLALLLAIYG